MKNLEKINLKKFEAVTLSNAHNLKIVGGDTMLWTADTYATGGPGAKQDHEYNKDDRDSGN